MAPRPVPILLLSGGSRRTTDGLYSGSIGAQVSACLLLGKSPSPEHAGENACGSAEKAEIEMRKLKMTPNLCMPLPESLQVQGAYPESSSLGANVSNVKSVEGVYESARADG